MKRVILALSGLFLAAGLCMAQNWQARHQIGTATQEMKTEGLSAAHSRIPIGSKAKVTNPANGLEIEVTITAEIPESPQRIIDLSPSAARALDVSPGAPVIVASLSQQAVPPENPDKSANASEVEVQMGKQPFYITINNYIMNSGKMGSSGNRQDAPKDQVVTVLPDYTVQTMDMAAEEGLPLAALPSNQPPAEAAAPVSPPETPPAAPPGKAPLFTSPPVNDPQIIPGLPNPNTNKIYRLMVGTYPGVDSAFPIYKQLQAAGFDVVQEQAGDMCRVFAAGIPASRVYYAAKRLGAIGFQQIWIQE
jgi:cell division septation protein DedD